MASHHIDFKEKNLRERSKYLNFWKRGNECRPGTSGKRSLDKHETTEDDDYIGIPKKMLKVIGEIKTDGMPDYIKNDKKMWKYWFQRYRLFSKFDEGIAMDKGKINGSLRCCNLFRSCIYSSPKIFQNLSIKSLIKFNRNLLLH